MTNPKIIGAARILVALAILGSITWQISDRLAHDLFRPTEYFAYFSIQTSIIAGATLLWTGLTSWSGRKDSKAQSIVRLAATACYILVSLAYNLLLVGMAVLACVAFSM